MAIVLKKLTFTGPPILGGMEFPYPTRETPLEPTYVPNHIQKNMGDGSINIKKLRWVERFMIGWKGLDEEHMAHLVLASEKGSVYFMPRSKAETDVIDEEPFQYQVRFISAVNFDTPLRPIHGEYDVEIELEVVSIPPTIIGDVPPEPELAVTDLLWVTGGDIIRYSFVTETQTNIGGTNPSGAVFYDILENWIYYASGNELRRSSLDGQTDESLGNVLSNGDIWSMKVHPSGNKFLVWTRVETATTTIAMRLYEYPLPFVDQLTRTLLFEETGDDIGGDGGVGVNEIEEHVYMSNNRAGSLAGKIYRVDFDGTNSQTILNQTSSSTSISDLVYDDTRNKIYFLRAFHKEIRTCDIDGTNNALLNTYTQTPNKIERNKDTDQIYVGYNDGSIDIIDPDTGSIVSQFKAANALGVQGIRMVKI